jgi:predicted transcriptional regulator
VDYVLVYATSPVRAIVGLIEVASVEVGSPSELWTKYGDRSALDHDEFVSYYRNADSGSAILIKRVHRLSPPVTLGSLVGGRHPRPPQSYCYLPRRLLNRLSLAAIESTGVDIAVDA